MSLNLTPEPDNVIIIWDDDILEPRIYQLPHAEFGKYLHLHQKYFGQADITQDESDLLIELEYRLSHECKPIDVTTTSVSGYIMCCGWFA